MPDVIPGSNSSALIRVVFHFLIIYLLLYILPFPLSDIPIVGGWFSFGYSHLLQGPITWLGHLLIGTFDSAPSNGGSGDKLYDYFSCLLLTILAIPGTFAWAIFDHRKGDYRSFPTWFTWLIALYLGAQMIAYGAIKIVDTQFPPLTTYRLAEKVGDMSPMGLLWTFMGYSKPYTMFAGSLELLGGILLFFRRTRLIGSLLLLPVLGNVLMLNLSYDVPVKLYSFHLLLMSVVLLAPYGRHLWHALVAGSPTGKIEEPTLFKATRSQSIFRVIKLLFLLSVIFYSFHQSYSMYRMQPAMATEQGSDFEVNLFVLRGDTIPVNYSRWVSIDMRDSTLAFVKYADGSSVPMPVQHPTPKTIQLGGADYPYLFTILPIDDQHELWKGTMGASDSIQLVVAKSNTAYSLISRGFHWVNERPFNR